MAINVTRACNLRCKHCYASTGKPFKDEITAKEIIKALEDMIPYLYPRRREIGLLGGEPLLAWDKCLEIIKYARGSGHYDPTITTNVQ